MSRSCYAREITRTIFLFVLLAGLLLSGTGARPAQAGEPETVPTRLEGYLKLIDPAGWWVGDVRAIVNDQTVVIEKRGRAEVGAWLVVQGVQTPDGTLVAEFIVVEQPAGRHGIIWPFSGLLTKQAGDLWVISETVVRVTAETSISGAPVPGWLVWVIVEQPSDALEPRAIAIEAIANDPARVPVEFEGILEATEPEWRVDGYTFRLVEHPTIIGTPVIGRPVEVVAVVQPDGSLLAHLVRVVDDSADAQLSGLVTDITTQTDGEQVWDLLVFPPETSAEPFAATAHVSANTLVDESRAVAQAGQWAEVQGITVAADEVRADFIRLDQPVPSVASGELRRIGAPGTRGSRWTVDGTPVWTDTIHSARLAGMVDSKVVIQGVRLGNGVLLAEHITPVTRPATGTMR